VINGVIEWAAGATVEGNVKLDAHYHGEAAIRQTAVQK
jgi:hypothetical protein